MEEDLRGKIWREMLNSKFVGFYLNTFLLRQKRAAKWYTIIVTAFSTSGVLGWAVWDQWPLMVCVLIAIMQLARLLESKVLMNNGDLESLNEGLGFYEDLFQDWDNLWFEFNHDMISANVAFARFHKLRKKESSFNKRVFECPIPERSKINKKADKKTRQYLSDYYVPKTQLT